MFECSSVFALKFYFYSSTTHLTFFICNGDGYNGIYNDKAAAIGENMLSVGRMLELNSGPHVPVGV